MFVKCLVSGCIVGGLIALAAVSYGCHMALKEPEFGWMAGIVVAGLGLCSGFLVFLTFLMVGLLAKLVASRSKPASERKAAVEEEQTETEMANRREQ
jgi:hypothetical protein